MNLAWSLVWLLIGLVVGVPAGFRLARGVPSRTDRRRELAETAQQTADTGLSERERALSDLVDPVYEALLRVQDQLHLAERDRLSSSAALNEHLKAMQLSTDGLRTEASQLVTALRSPQVRGRWGELQLERTVEAAGMVEHVDYTRQPSSTENGVIQRPDLVVHLVGGRQIVIDSKVAFAGYLDALEATDEPTRASRMRAHARHLRQHVDDLNAKAYWRRFTPTPEFVVCFVPADAFLDAALKEDPTMLEHAFGANVVLATPSTLVALLRTIGYGWRQDALARNTEEVSRLGKELYLRLSTMGGYLDKLGRSLSTAVGSFNSTVGAFEGRVLVSARRLADLSVVEQRADGQLQTPEQILATTRVLSSDELIGRVP